MIKISAFSGKIQDKFHPMLLKSHRLLILVLLWSVGFGQTRYPADSLLADSSVGWWAKAGLLPIAAWERLSFNSNLLNCQHYPSCSLYGAGAVAKFGLLRGSVMAADRIVRCNPAARYYQLRAGRSFHEPDGRIVDPVVPDRPETNRHSPALAAALSSMVPGAGRVYAGRPFDGLAGFLTVVLFYSMARESTHRQHPLRAGILWTGTVTFYLGEIYGAWRMAKYD